MPEPQEQPTPHPEIYLPRIEGETHERYLDRLYGTQFDKVKSGELSREDFIALQRDERLRLENLADHDGLTGLLNYRGVTEVMVRDMELIRQTNSPAVLGFVDVDDLTGFNNTYGHPAGNELLIAYSQVLERGLNQIPNITSVLGRYGGDEFVFLLPGMGNIRLAEKIAQDISSQITQAVKEKFNNPTLERTVSIGLTARQQQDTLQTLLVRADQALYEAKEERNKVVIK